MNLLENLRMALVSLRTNKLRSGLTVLGIVIGVAAVISMLSVGRGAQAGIQSQITSVGSNLLFVRPGSASQGGVNLGGGTAGTLTNEDAQALADPSQVPEAAAVSPEGNSFGQLIYLGNNTRTRVVGATDQYATVHDLTMAEGQFFSSFQVSARSNVVILGASVASQLFTGADPLSKIVRINNQPFTVIGVLQAKGGSGFGNQDDMVLVPLTTMQVRLARGPSFRGSEGVEQIAVKVVSQSAISPATSEIEQVLRQRHHILYQDDFVIQSQQDILAAATAATNTFTIFLGGIAAISLLVGGIGIMNIMLVSVSERTREIGIRKAVGARRGDIQMQFLVESATLSLLGGLLGVAVGLGISRALGQIRIGGTGITPSVSLDAIVLATVFSLLTGVFFGLYPASRAARLNPIDALHYE